MAISTLKFPSKNSPFFKKWLKDYLKNSTTYGCVHYVSTGADLIGRVFWLVGHIVCVTCVISMIVHVTMKYASISTVTTAETGKYPIRNVDFPGVAICGLNKINYSAAMELAEDILDYYPIANLTIQEVTEMLKYLGHLYLFELNDNEEDDVNFIHSLLIKRYKKYVPAILWQLVPSCHWILEHCSWGGIEQFCEDIFSIRKTGEGYCCTFNYARKSDDFTGKNSDTRIWESVDVERSEVAGRQFGLTVLMRSDTRNHYYKILPALGYKILIFPPMDFPDAPSGGVREVLVSPSTIVSLTLYATSFYSVPEVSRYSVDSRGCLLNDELSDIFGKYYSYSDCIMYCRIADIRQRCHCIPFFYPTPQDEGSSTRTCDLRDLACLKKYNGRWTRISPKIDADRSPDDVNGALNCTSCLPSCNDVSYKVSVGSTPLLSPSVYMGRSFHELNAGHSILNVFFEQDQTVRLKQDVLFYWYDLLSTYGGLCGLFLGISVISVAELLYFLTLRLYDKKYETIRGMRRKRRKRYSRITFVQAAKPRLRPLYWNEMIQPNTKY